MLSPIACIACSIDPQTTSLLVPLAQATLITTPILLRRQLVDGVRRLRDRMEGTAASPDGEPPHDDEESTKRPRRV